MAEQLTPEEAQLIRDRLDALEAAAAEKHKPWYRDPASALSLVAIIASVITFVISQRSQDVQDIRARKEQLEGLLTNLVSLEADFNSSVSPIADPLKREQMSSLFNTKRLIFLEEAEILMDQLGKNVSTSEYGVLANELSSMSSFKKAEIYYERAVGAAQDDVSRAMALRSLAGFYFLPTQLRDFDRGRQYFQEAVDAVKESQGDDYSKYTIGYTYESWGWSEKYNGFGSEGDRLLERAAKFYGDMSTQNPLRQWALESYATRSGGPSAVKQPWDGAPASQK
jgi:tetratricopeptide (TPR) repeat protein